MKTVSNFLSNEPYSSFLMKKILLIGGGGYVGSALTPKLLEENLDENFEEETIDAFEVGLKTDLADGRVRLNGAAFFYTYDNLQYLASDPEVFQGVVGNIPESEIMGAELELGAFLTDSLIFDARLAWLDTEITSSHLALDNVQSEAATNALLAQGISLFSPDV